MATVFDVYDAAGGQSLSAGGGVITLNLDTTREDEPSGDSPFTLASDVLTIDEAGVFLFQFRYTLSYASGTNTSTHNTYAFLDRDTGSGYAEVAGSRAYLTPDSATTLRHQTSTSHLALTVTSGDDFRVRLTATGGPTWTTTANASGLTVTSLAPTRTDQASSVAVAALAAGPRASQLVAVAFAAHVAGMAESSFTGSPVADALTALDDFQANGDWRGAGSAGARSVRDAISWLNIYQDYAADND